MERSTKLMQLEVVVTGASEAASAQQAGASRLELVVELERGGITPPERVIDEVVRAVTIPVHAIVRPHSDGFVYDASSRAAILESASRLRNLGVTCIVFGALDAHSRVEAAFVREVGAVAQLPMTFHRAFDDTHNLSAAYATLAGIPRVERVLTSGGAGVAWEGRKWLRELNYGNTFPTVVACGDVQPENVMDLVRYTGVREIHVARGARSEGKLDPKKIERLARLLYEGSAR
jgi:copper homeostasis protein